MSCPKSKESTRPRFPWGVMLALSCLFFSLPAWSQTDPDELARRHFESGAAYFEQAEYDSALREFRKAFELSQRPQILRNISVVEERLGNVREAIDALDQYLTASPSDPDIATVRIRRHNLWRRWEREEASRQAQEREALAAAQVEKQKSTPAQTVKDAPPRTQVVNATPAPQPEVEQKDWTPVVISLSAAGVLGLGSAVTGILAQSEYNALEDTCALRSCDDRDTGTGEALALSSTVLTGLSLTGAIVGAVLWASLESSDSNPAPNVTSNHGHGWWPQLNVQADDRRGYAEATWNF